MAGCDRVRTTFTSARLGLIGHCYSGMLDIMTDVTLVLIVFGTHVEVVEVDGVERVRSRGQPGDS